METTVGAIPLNPRGMVIGKVTVNQFVYLARSLSFVSSGREVKIIA